MKILVDCRAFMNNGTSVSVYTYNLANNLIKKRHHFVLILNNKEYVDHFSGYENVNVIYSNTKNNVIWDNIVIPYYSIRKKVDIIVYPKSSSCWFKIRNKRVVTTIHGMIYKVQPENHTFIENIYWRVVGKISSIIADRIIVVSNLDKKDLVAEGYNPNKICVIPIGISDSFFSKENYEDFILNKYNLIENRYLIQVGHISKKKNQIFTISLFNEILKEHPDFKLIFIGSIIYDSNYHSEILDYISNLGITSNIIFAGMIDQNSNPEIIPSLLNKSTCALFPSTYEGFGMPAVEAIAAGTPILASNKGSLPEVLGKENVLPLEKKEIWLKELDKLINDKIYKDILISKQRSVIKKYTWENIADQYLNLFESLVEK